MLITAKSAISASMCSHIAVGSISELLPQLNRIFKSGAGVGEGEAKEKGLKRGVGVLLCLEVATHFGFVSQYLLADVSMIYDCRRGHVCIYDYQRKRASKSMFKFLDVFGIWFLIKWRGYLQCHPASRQTTLLIFISVLETETDCKPNTIQC